jgi:hypothetical protein
MQVVRIETLKDFTGYVEDTFTNQDEVLFRGQPEDLPLVPSIARGRLTYGTALEAEMEMLDEFKRHSAPFLAVPPTTLWDWMALAQHHGLPTRLLDWSQNPLMSLWFVVRRPSRSGQTGVIWVLHPGEEDFATAPQKDSLASDRHLVFAPTHLSQRIAAQVAWFTVHKSRDEASEFEPLEHSAEFAGKLTKIVIPAERFAHFRFNLDRCGFNAASVFPGLDGLCAHIRWKRFYAEDEIERPR